MSKANPADALRPGRGTTRSHRGARWIVATQVGLCLVLIVGAGLLSETVRRLSSQPLGFDAAPLAVANVRLPPIAGLTPEQRSSRTQAVVDRLARLPGVVSAAATSSAPFGSGSGTSGFQIPGKNFERAPNANRHIVTEEYFETLGIRAIKGRVFDATDRRGEYGAVVTDVFERTLMDGDAVGRTFVLNGNDHTVLGVIEAPKHRRYSDDPPIAFYLLSRQLPEWGVGNYLVRAAREPEALLPSIRQAVSEVEPQVSFIAVETMETMMSRSIGEERYRSQLALAFAAAALLLAGIGLYGVIARTVNDQRKEIGVRLALGASPRAVRQEVIGGALIVTALGLVPGVPAAIAASHGIATLLYGIAPISPPVLIAATVVVAAAAIVAALGPALRAARIDPIEALRN